MPEELRPLAILGIICAIAVTTRELMEIYFAAPNPGEHDDE